MDDRFELNKYSAIGLIMIGIGLFISDILHYSAGTLVSIAGIAGFLMASKLDTYVITGMAIWGIGILFVISHWPYSDLIILTGTILTITALFIRFKKDGFKNYKRWIWISLLLIFISYHLKILLISYYFNTPRLDYSLYVFNMGALSLVISYGLRFVKKNPKKFEDFLKLILIYSVLINYVFRLGHYPGYKIITFIAMITIISWGGYSLFTGLKMKKMTSTHPHA